MTENHKEYLFVVLQCQCITVNQSYVINIFVRTWYFDESVRPKDGSIAFTARYISDYSTLRQIHAVTVPEINTLPFSKFLPCTVHLFWLYWPPIIVSYHIVLIGNAVNWKIAIIIIILVKCNIYGWQFLRNMSTDATKYNFF